MGYVFTQQFRWHFACYVYSKRFDRCHKFWNWLDIWKISSNWVCIFQTWICFSNILTFTFFSTGSFNPHSTIPYNELMAKIERLSKLIHLILVKVSTTASTVTPLLVVLINYFILDMADQSFHFEGTYWFPFDQNKPAGFFEAVLFQIVANYVTLLCFTPIGCIFIGSCWFIVTFLKDIARDISHLRKRKIANLKKQELTERIRNFVRFHADVEELVKLLR